MSIFDAAVKYRAEGVPLVVVAGAEYGTGSSRDWAAKGTLLLGVRAVLANSFERIHRSNLVGMGVLPLEFLAGQTWQSLHLTGEEVIDIADLNDAIQPGGVLAVRATAPDGNQRDFSVRIRIDTPVELDYYRNGGILQTVLQALGRLARNSMNDSCRIAKNWTPRTKGVKRIHTDCVARRVAAAMRRESPPPRVMCNS